MTVTATKSPAPVRHRSVSDHLTVRRDARPVSLLVLAVTAVATVGKPFIEIPGIINASAHRVRSVNLDLFHEWVAGTTIWYGKYTNTFGNIALFIPVGLVLVALAATAVRGRASRLSMWLRAVVIAAGLSVGIEVTQYIFALGYSDVDDVLFNTAGAAMGAWAMLRLDHERQTKLLWRLGFLAAALLVIVVCGLVTGIIG